MRCVLAVYNEIRAVMDLAIPYGTVRDNRVRGGVPVFLWLSLLFLPIQLTSSISVALRNAMESHLAKRSEVPEGGGA